LSPVFNLQGADLSIISELTGEKLFNKININETANKESYQ
jgi:hypothetical protein